jgi:hypothetical protein
MAIGWRAFRAAGAYLLTDLVIVLAEAGLAGTSSGRPGSVVPASSQGCSRVPRIVSGTCERGFASDGCWGAEMRYASVPMPLPAFRVQPRYSDVHNEEAVASGPLWSPIITTHVPVWSAALPRKQAVRGLGSASQTSEAGSLELDSFLARRGRLTC